MMTAERRALAIIAIHGLAFTATGALLGPVAAVVWATIPGQLTL